MTIDTAVLGVLVSLIFSVLGGGYFLGRLTERVKSNRMEIEENKKDAAEYKKENKEAHADRNRKLDKLLLNGKGDK